MCLLALASVFFGVVIVRPGADLLFGPFYPTCCQWSIFGPLEGTRV
jgi:hypothetical protein